MYASSQPMVNPYSSVFASSSSNNHLSSAPAAPASAPAPSSSLSAVRPDFSLRRSRSDSSNSSTSSMSSNATTIIDSSNVASEVLRSEYNTAKLDRAAPSKKQSTGSHLAMQAAIRARVTRQCPQQRPIIFEQEHQDEIIDHMAEVEAASVANLDLMNAQPELRWFMRPYLVDFIIEIHQTFRLRPETLYLTMNIADRYVSKRIVFKRHYQLVGSAALLIASKYEDAKDRVPTIADLSLMCCQAYDESAFLQMEGHILQTLSWQLGHPTPEAWLRILCMQSPEEPTTQNVARFLMENTLFHRNFIGVPSSLIASGALMLARHLCRQEARKYLARSSVASITSIAQMIDNHIGPNLDQLSLILIKKYSYQHFSAASTIVQNSYTAGRISSMMISVKAANESFKPTHSVARIPSTSSDSMDDDIDSSMEFSVSSSPSSMNSTPSRYRHKDADEEEEDDDEDMPVTPLTAECDPMTVVPDSVAVSPSRLSRNKENQVPRAFPRSTSMGCNSSNSSNSSSSGSVDVNLDLNLNLKSSNLYDEIPSITVQHVHARGTAAAASVSRAALTANHTWQATA